MPLRVEAVEGRRGPARFIDVPWHLFDPVRHPHWIAPLRLAVKDLLDVRKNPFYRNADIQMFVASDGGRTVGRIAAIENRAHNRHHGDRVGFFGFFDCVDDHAAAAGLFAAAEGWISARGLRLSRGPVSPSMNHESGLLVDGFDSDPMVFTPWNPPYYDGLLTGNGYQKAADLLGFRVPFGPNAIPERLVRLAERTRRRHSITFRDADFRHFEDEVRRVWAIYVEAWAGNWGFVPPDWPEFWHLAKGLEPFMLRGFCYLAEMDGEAVGFMINIRNLNLLLRRIPSGRLGPIAIARLLLELRRPATEGRVLLLGMKPKYRSKGLFPLFVHEAWRRGTELGARQAEASWVLEDNTDLTGPLEAIGLPAYRRWRIYDKALSQGSPQR